MNQNQWVRHWISKAIFSLYFSVVLLLGRCSVIGDIWAPFTENYIKTPKGTDFLAGVLGFIVAYGLLTFLQVIYQKVDSDTREKSGKGRILFLVAMISFMVFWLPYFLAFYPGGVYSDTFISFGEAAGYTKLNNHYPILYTGIIWMCMKWPGAWGNFTMITRNYTILQYTFMAAVFAYFIVWLYRKGMKHVVILSVFIFMAFFPLYPLYAIAVWKDTLFSLILFMFTLMVFNFVLSKGKGLTNKAYIAGYVIWGLLVIFLRNNGIYIFIATTVVLILWMGIKNMGTYRWFTGFALGCAVVSCITLGPIYNALGLNVDSAVESLGVPIQQVAAVVAKDGAIPEDVKVGLETICPLEDWKSGYVPMVVDSLKWLTPTFKGEALETDVFGFLKNWAKLLIPNFGTYVEAYLMETNSFWNPIYTVGAAYIQTGIWGDNPMVASSDHFITKTGIDLGAIVNGAPKISEGAFLLFFLMGIELLILNDQSDRIIGYVPIIVAVLTIFLATPVASSLRYVYYLVLAMPLCVVAPLLSDQRETM